MNDLIIITSNDISRLHDMLKTLVSKSLYSDKLMVLPFSLMNTTDDQRRLLENLLFFSIDENSNENRLLIILNPKKETREDQINIAKKLFQDFIKRYKNIEKAYIYISQLEHSEHTVSEITTLYS